jgi:hypothetical protein
MNVGDAEAGTLSLDVKSSNATFASAGSRLNEYSMSFSEARNDVAWF